jgi:hypothetical protein
MLEDFDLIQINETVYRLANSPGLKDALSQLQIEVSEITETIEFLRGAATDDVAALLRRPFSDDVTYKPKPTRFSDSSWKVFYGALEPETCAAEVGSWCVRNMQSDPPTLRRFYYREFFCRLDGSGFDLRPMKHTWLFLTGDVTSYPQCQDLAREARAKPVDVILCPSACRDSGTTAPVFVEHVLSNPQLRGIVSIEIDANNNISLSSSKRD